LPAATQRGLENGAYDTAIAHGAAGRFHDCRPGCRPDLAPCAPLAPVF